MHTYLMNTNIRLPVEIERGNGYYVYDTNGNSYIDAQGGIAVNTLGHNHPVLVKELQNQISKIIHCSNHYNVPQQEQLAKKLIDITNLDSVFFCSTGLEANEAAIKLARKYGHDKGIENPEILVFEKGFHGRSIATMAATDNTSVRNLFSPAATGFKRIQRNNISELDGSVSGNTVAVLIEIVQGEGGINLFDSTYLKYLNNLCKERDILLIVDEVQCGMGRTGKWFAYHHYDIFPDVIVIAKGLGSGVPVGAIIGCKKVSNVFKPGTHSTTFGGNPLAMCAGITTMDVIKQDNLLENVSVVGKFILDSLKSEFIDTAGIVDIRGIGLFIGIEFEKPATVLTQMCYEKKLMVSVVAETVLKISPPLILDIDGAKKILQILIPTIKEFL